MHKNIILAVGITILFLGLAIQPSLATPQLKKIDIEPDDVEGLVAQLRVVINEILQDYGHIPIIRTLGNKIVNILSLFGLILYCVFITILLIPLIIISLILNRLGFIGTYIFAYLFVIILVIIMEWDDKCHFWEWNYHLSASSNLFLKSLFKTNSIDIFDNFTLTGFDECPCMQE